MVTRHRMTATQRADRDFWLDAADKAYRMAAGDYYVDGWLCHQVRPDDRRREQLSLFENPDCGAWWLARFNDTRKHPENETCGPAEGRVLAACFLAAMCETGDI